MSLDASFRCARCHRLRLVADRWTPKRPTPGRMPPLCRDCRPGRRAQAERARRFAALTAILTDETLLERIDNHGPHEVD